MEKSPVFKTMFTADFKEKNALEIELPDKDLHHFLVFLRCTLDGYDDHISDLNVHFIIPIAHEYQVKQTLDKADLFLSNHYENQNLGGNACIDIVNGIIEAEKYDLTQTLNTLIDFASRKKFAYISQASDFNAISKKVLHKISMARWQNDIDGNTGKRCITSKASYEVRN
ncbi:unnamed protein product [Mytilus edulis]|uniref:BTB domain-containing protein n=1 Tax=Mytilus edulis TaxID=6550 RepID=A0A8S3T9V6_MYTED|nr:unnamed protein product [Mytilus edulis]